MKTYKYNLSFESPDEIHDLGDLEFYLNKYPKFYHGGQDFYNFKISCKEEDNKVIYPVGGAEYIEYISITFKNKVSKDLVENIVNYWGSIPFVGEVKEINWEGNQVVVYLDVSKSKSSDINKRGILERLLNYLENGTPLRHGSHTRAFEKVGEVEEIRGHYNPF